VGARSDDLDRGRRIHGLALVRLRIARGFGHGDRSSYFGTTRISP
jgi:hypothetical protein